MTEDNTNAENGPEQVPENGAPEGESAQGEPTDPAENPEDAAAEALAAAQTAIDGLNTDAAEAAAPSESTPFEMPSFAPASGAQPSEASIDLLRNVNLNVKIELGRTRMLLEDVLRLGDGCVIELDKLAGDPVDVYVNERLIAKGEVLVLNDNFCVRVSEIVDPESDDGAVAAQALAQAADALNAAAKQTTEPAPAEGAA